MTKGLAWCLRWWRICLQCRRPRFNPWVGKIPWRREWLPISVFLPGESHGQRSLVGYSIRGVKSQTRLSDCDTGDQSPNLYFIVKKKFALWPSFNHCISSRGECFSLLLYVTSLTIASFFSRQREREREREALTRFSQCSVFLAFFFLYLLWWLLFLWRRK